MTSNATIRRASALDMGTIVKLHASQHGEPVYRTMGFCDTSELSLVLSGSSVTTTPGAALNEV